MNKKPALGDTVRHTITKYEGVVIAVTTWLNGCERLSVQSKKLDKDKKPQEHQVFDIQELEVIDVGSHLPAQLEPPKAAPPLLAARPGGARENVSRGQKTPSRSR